MTNVISVEHLSKQYDLGVIGTGTLTRDLERWWARIRHKPDPYSLVGTNADESWLRGSILALDDVSFTVQQGEALGIIGKNGAGKSTLLKILSRVTAPTSGVVKVKGRIGSLLEVGTGFHPELTGRENVYLNGTILGMKKAEVDRKFDEIVAFSGVEKFIDTPVKRYSSGMYVRLAFAVAAHLDPEILIVDEVLAVGDAEFQKKCLGKMSDVAGEGRTVLFVSHNMGSIKQLCEQGIFLSEGKIHYQGEINECIDMYLNMNLSDGSTILAHQTYHHEDFLISQILVNDRETDFVPFSQKQDSLTINIKGKANSPLPVDLELKIKDIFGTPLAFYSYGHLKGIVRQIEPGEFDLTWTVKLPGNMLRGDYLLDIEITNPNKQRWACFPNAIRLSVDGLKTKNGRYIEYRSGAGWLMLE